MSGRPGLFRIVRNKFVTGLIILIPIVFTVQALWWLFTFVDSKSQPVAMRLIGRYRVVQISYTIDPDATVQNKSVPGSSERSKD